MKPKDIDFLIEALLTDGGHHKQWYLEELLKRNVNSLLFERLKAKFNWEEGIPD